MSVITRGYIHKVVYPRSGGSMTSWGAMGPEYQTHSAATKPGFPQKNSMSYIILLSTYPLEIQDILGQLPLVDDLPSNIVRNAGLPETRE